MQRTRLAIQMHPIKQARFSITRGHENRSLHDRWRTVRSRTRGFGDPQHPFRYRGEGKAYTYKLFLEQAHSLLVTGGRLGFVVPSGLYSDHGTASLRCIFLDQCRWEWLFGIENRDKIFPIDSRFKFNPIVVQKGGTTEAIRTAFMRRSLDDWERADELATSYTRAQVERFSPRSRAILEIQSQRDLEILEKIYSNSVLLGDQGPNGWGIRYATEFHMTNDSRLFPPRPQWEAKGYRPDEYSRWLLGDWRPIKELWHEIGIDPSKPQPAEIELEDWLFDTTAGPERRQAEAKFVHGHLLKPGDVARTNWRVRCAQPPYDQLPIPRADNYVREFPLPHREYTRDLSFFRLALSLNCSSQVASPTWIHSVQSKEAREAWKGLWSITESARIRQRVVSDVAIAYLQGLEADDIRSVLSSCEHATANGEAPGFWRVDKEKPPELRRTILAVVAFEALDSAISAAGGDRPTGIQSFFAQNYGEGWMLPESIRLDDYGFDYGGYVRGAASVARLLGPRFCDWQLTQSVDESWRECRLHTRNLLGTEGYAALRTRGLVDEGIYRRRRGGHGSIIDDDLGARVAETEVAYDSSRLVDETQGDLFS